jgi:hypothetical protein
MEMVDSNQELSRRISPLEMRVPPTGAIGQRIWLLTGRFWVQVPGRGFLFFDFLVPFWEERQRESSIFIWKQEASDELHRSFRCVVLLDCTLSRF